MRRGTRCVAYGLAVFGIALSATAAAPPASSEAMETMYIIASRIHAGPAAPDAISLDVSQGSVAELIHVVGAQLGVGVVLRDTDGAIARRGASAHVRHASGAGVLDVLLEDNGLEATRRGDLLFVGPRPVPGAGPQIGR